MDEVTEYDLTKAYAGEVDEPAPQFPEEVETSASFPASDDEEPLEPADPIERTKFGRKLKRLEETMVTKADLLELKEMLQRDRNNTPAHMPLAMEEPDDDEIIGTVGDLKKFLARREEQQQRELTQMKLAYERDYRKTLSQMESDPEYADIADQIHSLVTDTKDLTFNRTYSGFRDPVADCEKNFLKAAMHVIKQGSKPKPKFAGNTPPVGPTGVGSSNTQSNAPKKMPVLDEQTKNYIKSMNLSDEEVAEMIG